MVIILRDILARLEPYRVAAVVRRVSSDATLLAASFCYTTGMVAPEKHPDFNVENHRETIFRDVELANRVEDAVLMTGFGDGRIAVPVTDGEVISQLEGAGLGLDYRAVLESRPGISSTAEGIAFDPENVRSQTFAIYEGENPVGVMSVVVAPKVWLAKRRYFKKEAEGVMVVDAHAVYGLELPDFCIIPAWTKVLDSHRGLLAHPGFSAIKDVIEILESSAPPGTWMEIAAGGLLPQSEMGKVHELTSLSAGSIIKNEELPFDINIFGQASNDSLSTVKMAKLLGLSKVEEVGYSVNLGPVFVKKVR